MKLSFVIPAYNEERYVGDCLAAIIEQKRPLPYDIEIIVVDNASTDGTAAVVSKYPGVKLVKEMKKGLLHARQAGFLAATGDLIAQIDADTKITPGWISRVMREFLNDEKLVALSGPYIYYDAPWKIRLSTRLFYFLGVCLYAVGRFWHVGAMVQGGNVVIRRTALEKIGGYDTTISFYGEDTNIARRLSYVGRVRFTFKLPTLSSARRLAQEGSFMTGLRYGVNYLWMTFFKKPFTHDYEDIRPGDKDAKQ